MSRPDLAARLAQLAADARQLTDDLVAVRQASVAHSPEKSGARNAARSLEKGLVHLTTAAHYGARLGARASRPANVREALEPFAAKADYADAMEYEDDDYIECAPHSAGDYRRARTILAALTQAPRSCCADERERCAKIAGRWDNITRPSEERQAAREIEAAIRSNSHE